jgi:hypothetical protein
MKRTAIALAIGPLAALFIFSQKSKTPTPSEEQADITAPTKKSVRQSSGREESFWDQAIVPDPGKEVPLNVIRPEELGVVPPSNAQHPSLLLNLAISENNLPAIQATVLSWFGQDPTATRDWLATQTTFDDLQPAISYIVSSIAEKGDLQTAVEWSALISDQTLHDDTLFQIHALALRNGMITPSEIKIDLIPADRHEELLSGAAGD